MKRRPGQASQADATLALESSGAACSAAVLHRGEIAAHRRQAMARGHAEVLMPMVIEAMQAAHLEFAALEQVAVTVGPGSFTGLRVGLATARGIGLALSRPVVGVTSFAALAEGLAQSERDGRHLLVVIDSKRVELYAQLFDPDLAAIDSAMVLAPAALAGRSLPAPLLVAGDGAPRLLAHMHAARRDVAFAAACGPPDAIAVARLAARPGSVLLPPRPLYLHPPEAAIPATSP